MDIRQVQRSELSQLARLYDQLVPIEHKGSYINFTSSTARTGAHEFYAKLGYSPDYVKGYKKRFPSTEREDA